MTTAATDDFSARAATWDDDPMKVARAAAVADGIRRRIPLDAATRALEYGSGTGLVSFALRPPLERVTLADSAPGTLDLHLGPENVLRPEEVEVVSVEPNTLRLRVDREGQRTLPVLPRIVGEPAAGASPLTPAVFPPTAVVAGPQSLISSLASVTTSPISLDGHALTFAQTVPVVSPDPLVRVLEPTTVTVQIPMESPDAGDETEAAPPARARPDRGGARR